MAFKLYRTFIKAIYDYTSAIIERSFPALAEPRYIVSDGWIIPGPAAWLWQLPRKKRETTLAFWDQSRQVASRLVRPLSLNLIHLIKVNKRPTR